MPPEYYDRLGVSADATTEEITEAYRERLKQVHPDVSDASDAGERTRQLIEAKEVLTDETERARYDRLGHDRYVGDETAESAAPEEAPSGRTDPGESEQDPTGGDTRHARGSAAGPGPGARGTRATRRGDAGETHAGSIDWESVAGEDWEAVSEAVWQEVTGGVTAGADSTPGGTAESGRGDIGPDTGARADERARAPGGGSGPGDGVTATTDRQTGGDRSVGWYREGDPSGTTREAWSVGNTTAGSRDWGLSDGPRRGTRVPPHRILSPGQTVGLFVVAFLCYPLLLGGALFAPLAPPVRVLAALGLVFVVAVLVVLPQLGVPVFGSWTLLFPLVLTELGLSVAAPATLFATGGALCSLVLAVVSCLLTRPPLV